MNSPENIASWPTPRSADRNDRITYLGYDFRVLIRRLVKGENANEKYVTATNKQRMAAVKCKFGLGDGETDCYVSIPSTISQLT